MQERRTSSSAIRDGLMVNSGSLSQGSPEGLVLGKASLNRRVGATDVQEGIVIYDLPSALNTSRTRNTTLGQQSILVHILLSEASVKGVDEHILLGCPGWLISNSTMGR